MTTILLPWACRVDLDYAAGLAAAWGSRDRLVLIEHDMAPTTDQVDMLALCPSLACTIPYRLAGGEPSLWRGSGDARDGYSEWGSWPEYVDGSALGVIALSPFLRERMPAPTAHWSRLAEALSDGMAAAGFRWHVHPGEVPHDHRR